jgi:hypothetical protein
VSFETINLNLIGNERILYWSEDSEDENLIFAATTKGLHRSTNKGVTWNKTSLPANKSVGTYLDHSGNQTILYHADQDAIYISYDLGASYSEFHNPSHAIRMFTAGRSGNNVTYAYGDDDGTSACAWASAYLEDWGVNSIAQTQDHCGYVWVRKNRSSFQNTNQMVGNFLRMAQNDPNTIYSTGAKEWIRQYGTKVFISYDAGDNWDLKFHQLNWDITPFEPWPSHLLDYSAIALDIGWWDDGYESFAINKLNSGEAGGTGYFFLHTTKNAGDNWHSPFTEYKDSGNPSYEKKWQTRGIEVISIYRLKTHPTNDELIYAASADIAGMVSVDGGESFRITKAYYNSNYDYAFDRDNDDIVYVASGNDHDWPEGWHANSVKSSGGIFRSLDRGLNYTRLTPDNSQFNRQFLSVGYDDDRNYIYGGTHSLGIAASFDNGQSWSYFNNGLPAGDLIIPQIEVDPDNGNVYALVTGNAPNFTNHTQTGIYFLDIENNVNSWQLLRGNVHYPSVADPGYELWYYPTAFAIDFTDPQRETLWLTDYENNGNWLMSGIWKSTDGGANWHRQMQMTHPTGITIDSDNTDHVFVSGSHYLDESWGNGGMLFTSDGGETWQKNLSPALQANARNIMLDPTNPNNIYYTYFGGGILKGPNPARSPASVTVENVTE